MDKKQSEARALESQEEMYHGGYHQDLKIANRYSVLSACDRRKQFKLGGTTTLINSYPEASVFTYLQDNQDGFAPVPGEDKVPSSMMTEDELSTWTKVRLFFRDQPKAETFRFLQFRKAQKLN